MCNCFEIHACKNVINQGGHPIALVSINTTLCEMSREQSRCELVPRMLKFPREGGGDLH